MPASPPRAGLFCSGLAMDAFVADLTRLYRLASSAPVDEFPRRALDLLRDWIEFDGAVFGFGEPASGVIRMDGVCVYNRDQALLPKYAELSRFDPVTRHFVNRPGVIQNVDTQDRYRGRENQPLAAYSKAYDLRHLLLVGDDQPDHRRLRWVVLYRGIRKAFDACEELRMAAAWRHLACALDLNRARVLDLHAPPEGRRSLALVSRRGVLEIADRAFMSLARREWRDLSDTRLPPAALKSLLEGVPYLGRQVELHFSGRGEQVVCEARERGAEASLSAREAQVARLYAVGNSYREIAEQLGSSPNTVRVQLARVYQKLDINDKATLARALGEVRGSA